MPEVCEVRLTAQYLSSMIGHKITQVKITDGRYAKKSMKGYDSLEFPLKIKEINTKGKFMWFTLTHNDETYYMLNTFGLTGKWSFEKLDFSHIKFNIKNKTNKYNLYFSDVRNFGTIEFTTDKKVLNKKLEKLGVDLLQTSLSDDEFQKIVKSLKNKKKKIVVVMMSQDAKDGIGSGLGNYLVPEILYRAKISPHRIVSSLTKQDLIALNKAIKHQLKLCYISNTTDYISHLSEFLKTHRKNVEIGKFPDYHKNVKLGKEKCEFNIYRRKTDDDGNEVTGEVIIPGRTTYWVSDVQV